MIDSPTTDLLGDIQTDIYLNCDLRSLPPRKSGVQLDWLWPVPSLVPHCAHCVGVKRTSDPFVCPLCEWTDL